MNPQTAFIDYVRNPKTGRPKRGALSRAAEWCGCPYTSARDWYFRSSTPKGGYAMRLAEFVKQRRFAGPKKRKDIGVKRGPRLRKP